MGLVGLVPEFVLVSDSAWLCGASKPGLKTASKFKTGTSMKMCWLCEAPSRAGRPSLRSCAPTLGCREN